MNKAMHLGLGAALIVAGALAGCSKPPAPGSAPAPGASETAGSITIKGSDTMVHLVNAWTEAYMAQHADASLSVTGGGTGTGIAALLNGTTDICMASRDISPEEAEKATAAGVGYKEHSVALDGIAVVVHPSNPLNEITMEDLAKIYTGEVANWSQVGGPDLPIQVTSRESSSGTYAFFQEHVLNKKDYGPKTLLLPATSAIVQSVSSDAGTIGYIGLGYLESAGASVKALGVKKDATSPATVASIESVKDGSYLIARKLHLYVTEKAPVSAQRFIEFVFSEAGQKIVAENGYVPV